MMDPRRFFSEYAKASIEGDVRRIADSYAEEFTISGPKGSATFRDDASFLKWIEHVLSFNRSAGMKGLEIVSVRSKETGKDKLTVDVKWRAIFVKEGREIRSEFEITYRLEISGISPRIVAYTSLEDQEEKMKELGII